MPTFNTFDAILQYEVNEQNARDYARNMVWSEIEVTKQSIKYARHIETINGVGIYYDYGADYYFFTDETTKE